MLKQKTIFFKDFPGPPPQLRHDWSIGGSGENLEIREPEQLNQVWAIFHDDDRLHLSGTPNLETDGDVTAHGNIKADIDRVIQVGSSTTWVRLHAASCCPNGFIDYGGEHLVFRRSGTGSEPNPLMLQSNGTVIINADPNYDGSIVNTNNHELSVNGGIYCEELEIIADVPSSDYVFENDYNLLPLVEVEAFINTEKHLPEVPSSKEFQENGYKVGEMDDLLLRKVEELTLYAIEADKNIRNLETDKEGLKEENEQLKEQLFDLLKRIENLEEQSSKK